MNRAFLASALNPTKAKARANDSKDNVIVAEPWSKGGYKGAWSKGVSKGKGESFWQVDGDEAQGDFDRNQQGGIYRARRRTLLINMGTELLKGAVLGAILCRMFSPWTGLSTKDRKLCRDQRVHKPSRDQRVH